MSQKDLQFIERALAHPWMFWVYFWKWPRIVRQACAEYAMLAKERDEARASFEQSAKELDAAKAAREQSARANEKLLNWVHVTHRLSTTPEGIRALFAAGKRLSVFVVFLAVCFSANAQLPPVLRQYFTTNAHVLSSGAGVLTNNGVGTPGTLGWLSLSSLASGSLWTNVASGSSVLGEILTPIEQYGIFQLATNRLGFWGDYSTAMSIGYPPVDLDQHGTNVPILFLIGDYTGDGATFTNDCFVFFGIGEQVFQNMVAKNSSKVFAMGEVAMGAACRLTDTVSALALGNHALYSIDLNNCLYISGIGHSTLEGAALTNSSYVVMEGVGAGQSANFHTSSTLFGFGLNAFNSSILTNCNAIMAIGSDSTLLSARLTNCFDITAIGRFAGTNLALTAKTNIVIIGNIVDSIPVNREFWFGNTNNIYRFPGNVASRLGFTNGSSIGATATNTLTLTNSHLVFSPNNTWDIGINGVNQPRDVWVAGGVTAGGNIVNSSGTGAIGWTGRGFILTEALGVFKMINSSFADFSRLQFGGTTAAFPAFGKTSGEGHLRMVDATGSSSTNSLIFGNTIDTTARTGMTVNRQAGRVRLTSGSQTYLLTNNLVTTSSSVTATVNTSGATAVSAIAVPTAGLLTLTLNVAASADCDISWFIAAP